MRLPISPEVLLRELEGARDLLDAKIAAVRDGIPGVTVPGQEVQLGEWLVEFTGEVMLVARKCESIATTLAEPPGE